MLSNHKCFETVTPVFKQVCLYHIPDGFWDVVGYLDFKRIFTCLSHGVPEEFRKRYRAFEALGPTFNSREEARLWCDMNCYQPVSFLKLIRLIRECNDIEDWKPIKFGSRIEIDWNKK